MQTTLSEVTALTLIISTALILLLGGCIIYFLFLYQRKKYMHQNELLKLKEAFNKTLLQSKLEIQEQTLGHISKELHANFSHLVSLININLAGILPQASEEMKEGIIETKMLAKRLLGELKALSASLNTDHIMHIGFLKAIENELSMLTKAKHYEVRLTVDGEQFRLNPEFEIILFRLCQEVFNNIVKYSQAKAVTVSIVYLEDRMELRIIDDGVGFNIELAKQQQADKESTGLLNIENRAKLINAQFSIHSKEGEGTNITLKIPKHSSSQITKS